MVFVRLRSIIQPVLHRRDFMKLAQLISPFTCQVRHRSLFIKPEIDSPTPIDVPAGIPQSNVGIDFLGYDYIRFQNIMKDRAQKFAQFMPKSQEELCSRTFKDSFNCGLVPVGTDLELREEYINQLGSIRRGKILEDIDAFAVIIGYQHIKYDNANKYPLTLSLVTAAIDTVTFPAKEKIRGDRDIRYSGHVTWTGKSSFEVTTIAEQKSDDGNWFAITKCSMILVVKDLLNNRVGFVNPLVCTTEEEKAFFEAGAKRMLRRKEVTKLRNTDACMTMSPNERKMIHRLSFSASDMFSLGSIDMDDVSRRERPLNPENTILMENCRLTCYETPQPGDRNPYYSTFGGYLLKHAEDLALACVSTFGQCSTKVPYLLRVDDIKFQKSVPVGSVLKYTASIAYVKDNYIHVPVTCEIYQKTLSHVSNAFHFVYCMKEHVLPEVIPRTYEEVLLYMFARRRYQRMNLKRRVEKDKAK